MDVLKLHRLVSNLPRPKPYGVDIDFRSPAFVQDKEKDWKFDYDEELNMRLFIGDFEGYKEKLSERLEKIFEEYDRSVRVKVEAYAYDEERGYDIPVELENDEGALYAKLPDGEEVYIGDVEEERSLYEQFIDENYFGMTDEVYKEHITGIAAKEIVFAIPNPSVGMESDLIKKLEEDAIKSLVNVNDEAIGKIARETGGSCEIGEGDKSLSCLIYTESERYPYIIVYVR